MCCACLLQGARTTLCLFYLSIIASFQQHNNPSERLGCPKGFMEDQTCPGQPIARSFGQHLVPSRVSWDHGICLHFFCCSHRFVFHRLCG